MGSNVRAVVLGGGIAGLLTARVLSDAYERVTIVERDPLPRTIGSRRGVPQDRHVHSLLPGGAQILERLLPGLLDEIEAGGAPVVHDYSEFYFSPAGRLLSRDAQPGVPFYLFSRPYLEHHIRARVRALPNIEILDQCDVVDLTSTEANDRITGARVQHRTEGSEEETLEADLVVDAMGRGARTPAWLAELGYERPHEEELVIRVEYASQLLRLQPGAIPEKSVVVGARPGRPAGGGLILQENDTWLFTVSGRVGQRPPTDFEARLDYIRGFMPARAVSAIRDAEPISEVATFRFPANRWRHYERLRHFPQGLLVVGDALCSFNPIYGQGMSVAALQAAALRDCLRHDKRDLPRRFFRSATTPINLVWQLAAGADLAMPEVEGPRPLSMRIRTAYLGRLQAEAEHDPILAARFMRVAFLVDPPGRLFRPATALRIMTGKWRRPAVPAPAGDKPDPSLQK
ncbi:FAD-dependent oxidoreductase [Allosalinactinospora lopnorensis]|uniref:FAD-dependent oxidoreductase n=1 Tax=Allosalinactinospora lopnorensis TaxID=1352348 RepID=UPI000623F426|nr:FAD-dependent monooxygenase [Allosalinactinospora lopnorensis]